MPGRIVHVAAFASKWVATRGVDVWLPPCYDTEEGRYPVLYVQDGQNLFDPAVAFGGVPWGLNDELESLIADGLVRPPIIVGIWNTKHRISEYMPQYPLEQPEHRERANAFEEKFGAPPCSDAYLRFLVEELKPFIDSTYRTLAGVGDTFAMGSSMGGLLSLYALCEYPDVFGGVACLSTSWTIAGGAVVPYLTDHLPSPQNHRIYFDYGAEASVPRYETLQRQVNRIITAAGYTQGINWITRRFPGAAHSEQAWRDRVDVPLRFLLAN